MSVLLPYVMAPVAVALIFSNMFGDNYGLVNTFLADIGLPPIPWHKRRRSASHIAIATMVNFRWTGYNTLILLAAMQAVPRDYYEAATDRRRRRVPPVLAASPLPSLRPTLIFVIITSTIGGLQIFDEPRMFDQYGTRRRRLSSGSRSRCTCTTSAGASGTSAARPRSPGSCSSSSSPSA